MAEHLRGAVGRRRGCTIGPALEEAASECFNDDPALGVALDALGSAAVDLWPRRCAARGRASGGRRS